MVSTLSGPGPGLNEVAERDARVAHAAVDRRFDLGKFQIQRGGILGRFGRTRRRRSTLISGSFLIELTRRNGVLGPQIFRAIQLDLR